MRVFPFNQDPKTKDCGYRCIYYILQPSLHNKLIPYEQWLENFRYFTPVKSGITFTDICTVLEYHEKKFKFTQLTEKGLFLIYSGSWLKHGHYFVYHNGVVFCSTKSQSERMPLSEVVAKLEATTIDGAFRCLKVEV